MPPKKKAAKPKQKQKQKQTTRVVVNVNSNNKRKTTASTASKSAQMPLVISSVMPAVAPNPTPAPDVNRQAELAQLRHEMQQGLNYTLAQIQAQQQQQQQAPLQAPIKDEVSVEEEYKPSPLRQSYLAQQRQQVYEREQAKARLGLDKVKGTPRGAASEYKSAQGTPMKPIATRTRSATRTVSAIGEMTGKAVRGAASLTGSLAKGMFQGMMGKSADVPTTSKLVPSAPSNASTATTDIARERIKLYEKQRRAPGRPDQKKETALNARLKQKMDKKGVEGTKPIDYARAVIKGKK